MRVITTFALILLIGLNPPAVADLFDDGVEAYKNGNYQKAFLLMQVYAKRGYGPAQGNIGMMYYHGQFVPQDYSKSAEWHHRAAEKGHVHSQAMLGSMYLLGEGVVQNYSKAEKWSSYAAQKGNAESLELLGSMYQIGAGVEKSLPTAYILYSLSVHHGNEHAIEYRDRVLAELPSEQINEAQRLASEWQVGTPLPRPENMRSRR